MKLVMTHGDESRVLDMSTMPIADAVACEKYVDMSWTEWREALVRDKAHAVAFAWWIAGRRAGLDVGKFSDVDLDLARLGWRVELTDEERAEGEAIVEEEAAEGPTGPAAEESPAT